ncbi:MAG: leucine-rich repeat protein [Treponemataceae bacterium]|nr:leucine-rich repeat protein [Treponemataceae bacterium]
MQDSEIFFLTNGGKILSGVDELNCPAELRVPFGVTKIERRALADCPAKKIFLPDTVTQIGYEAFSGCDALEYVRFPKKIESVEPSIFRGCFSLQKVELGDEILELSENMFECCYSLEEAPFRSGILELPRNVFSECVSLKSLVIPEGVAVIKSGAAAYCQNLSTLVLPSSIKVIEDDAFRSCVSLAHIRFSAENPVFFTDEDSGALFEKHEDGTFSLIKVPVNAKQIRIPKNITHSHSEAFQGCDSIEKVFIDCALTDHPLFVALKTEIVDAQFIDETQIQPEAKSESKQKKPRKTRAKKSEVSAEKKVEKNSEEKAEEKIEKTAKTKKAAEKSAVAKKPKAKSKKQTENESANSSDEKNSGDEKKVGKKSPARVKKSAKTAEVEKVSEVDAPSEKKADKAEAKSEIKSVKKGRVAKKEATQFEIVEPETPEPSEPKIDDLFADVLEKSREEIPSENISVEESAIEEKFEAEIPAEEQTEISAAPQVEENETHEIEDPLGLEIEEPVVETVPELEIEESAIEEGEPAQIEDAVFENLSTEEPQVQSEELEANQTLEEENSEQEDSSDSADDMLADILGQNIVSAETSEEEGIEGVTITVEELDEAMMRGIQEEDERSCEVPEGFFPSKNSESEEEPENLPPPEPRFINGMIGVSSAYEVVEEKTLYPERAEEDLCQTPPNEMEDITTLIVVTQSVTSENKISQSLKNFCIDLARKLNLKRIYFFGALSLDNEEFLYGFVKFALCRNVIYAADASEFDSLSEEIKSFAEIADISSPVSPFQNVAQDNSLELEMPFKIFVQDNLDDSGAGQNSIQENSEEAIPQTKMPASENESKHSVQAEKKRVGKGLLRKAEAALQTL